MGREKIKDGVEKKDVCESISGGRHRGERGMVITVYDAALYHDHNNGDSRHESEKNLVTGFHLNHLTKKR